MAITLKTYGEQLAEVQAAISAVMTSQRYEAGGRVLWRADLEMLHKREQDLQEKLDKYGDVIPNTTAVSGRVYGVSFV
jgi:hypothetical protein